MVQTILSAWNTLLTARHVSPWHWYSTVWLSLRISSEALHKKRMKACIYTGLLWASLKFYHCGMNIKKNSWVRGEWDLIIVSGVIISLRARKTPTRFFFFFFAKNHLHLHCEVFQGHSEHSMAQDGTVWIICTWNMQTSTLPSCTVKWWVSEHVLSHLIASAFKRRQHLICATVRRALISRQTSTVFLESHQVCFVQMYQQRFIRVHKWTLVCLLVSLFVSPCTSFFFPSLFV